MTMPFISIDWTVIAQLLNTLILFLLLKKFLFVPVKNIIDQRQAEIDKIYVDAQSAKDQALTMQAEYSSSIAGARAEAQTIVNSATKTANVRSDEIVAEANTRAAQLLQRAEGEIAREKKKAINEIKDEISDMAIMIAQKVVGREISPTDHEQLITQFIDNVGE